MGVPSAALRKPVSMGCAGITNWEFRLRFQANVGEKLSEYGEKEAAMKTEIRIRRYF